MKLSCAIAFFAFCLLPLINGQAPSSTCCSTTECFQNLMQQNIIRLGQVAPGPNQVSLNPLVYNPPMRYNVDVDGIKVNITLINNELQGVQNAIVSDLVLTFCGRNMIVTYVNTIPRVTHTANYNAVGYIQDPSTNEVTNIDENGVSTFYFPQLIFTHIVNLTREDRDGGEVWKTVSATMNGDFTTGHVDFRSSSGSDETRRALLERINADYSNIIENIRPQIIRTFNDLYLGFVQGNLDGVAVNALLCPVSEEEESERRARSC